MSENINFINFSIDRLWEGLTFEVVLSACRYAIAVKLEGVSPAVTVQPTLRGDGTVGSTIELNAGIWSGIPDPTVSVSWLRDGVVIPGATDLGYLTSRDDNGRLIACRVEASNELGSTVFVTEAIQVLYRRPIAPVARFDEVFDQEPGAQTVDTSSYFEGVDLSYSAVGGGATVDQTGVLSIPTDQPLSGVEIAVTASNPAGSATVVLVATVEASGAPGLPLQPADAVVSFAGPSIIQIAFAEGRLTIGDRVPAVGSKVFTEGLSPTSELGGSGTLDGVSGRFTGDRNTASSQLFSAWPVYAETRFSPAFQIIDGDDNRTAADDANEWTVLVDGTPATVTAVHRKTVPTKTLLTADGRRSERRHTVSLTLASPLAVGTPVGITPPAVEATLWQDYMPEVTSEVVHVCHEGYPIDGPKKGYVGLWLGHDNAAAPGATDGAVSASTSWTLVRKSDGMQVASGTLALIKAASSAHIGGVNFNGCDIYEADFSAVSTPGTYCIEVAGVGRSVEFDIAADAYASALRLAARAFFYQRSGCAIDSVHGEGFTRPRNGHPADGLTVWQSDVKLGSTSEGYGSDSPFPLLNETPIGSGAAGYGPEIIPENIGGYADPAGSVVVSDDRIIWQDDGFGEVSVGLFSNVTPGKTYRVIIDVTRPVTGGTLAWRFDSGWPASSSPSQDLAESENVFTFNTGENTFQKVKFDGQGAEFAINSISVREVLAEAEDGVENQNAWGGWHDAGDWDRRIQHAEAVYFMAQIVEAFPAVRGLDLNLPESGSAFADAAVAAKKNAGDAGDGATVLPDLIHEALWGLSLWRRTQRADGAILGGVEYSSENISGSVSWNPVQNTFAYGYEDWAAYKFAMAAAKLGHVIKTVCGDATLGDALIAEAAAAWTWAEAQRDWTNATVFAAAPDTVRLDRLRAAPVVYRAAGTASARTVWESYTSFGASSGTGLPGAGSWIGWHPYDYTFQGLDYYFAGEEGRAVNGTTSSAVHAWASSLSSVAGSPIATDYGLRMNDMYQWGVGWFRFGPGSNWMASRHSITAIATGSIGTTSRDAVLSGMWFALGCNPSNVSLVKGLGKRDFGQHMLIDFTYPGALAVGPAAGDLRWWENDFIGDSLYPKSDAAWPSYARIFESQGAIVSSEFAINANMMEWLFACAMAVQAQQK